MLATMCTIAALTISTTPAGLVVGLVPEHRAVQIEQVSLLRDYVFISKPTPDGFSPRGWVQYGGLTPCGYHQQPGG
jgi:hypothetical protein